MKVSVEDGGRERMSSGSCLFIHCTPEQPETSLDAGSLAFMAIYIIIRQYISCLYKWNLDTSPIVLRKDFWENNFPCEHCPHQMQQ